MGQYKGKRESSRPENEPHSEPRRRQEPVGDPFSGEQLTFGERMENIMLDINWFFHSKKGKILVSVLCSIVLISVIGVVGFKAWMNRPPELPPVTDQTDQNTPPQDQNQQPDNTEPPPPTDDELYPDDGYGGEMPEVSGERKKGVYTFLLVGTDKDDGNTDTIMVASYDTVNQTVNIMSIPRDTMINESWDLKKINSVYSRTGNSINSLSNRIKKLVGFKPDYYVKVDLSVFVQLVDLVGGVEFYVPQDMKYDDPYQDLHIDLKEGLQVLDGDKAMQLVRFRGYGMGDIQRVAVQQDFMKALIQECLSLKHWGKIKAYIDLALDNVQTDLSFGSIVWFAANVMGLNDAPMLDMANVNTHTIPGNYLAETWSRAVGSNQSYVTIYPNQVVKLVNESFNPYVQDITTGMIDAMSILENGDIASSTGVLKDTIHNEVMAVRRGEAYYDEEGNIVYNDPEGEGEGSGEGETDEPTIDPNAPDDGTAGENNGENDSETTTGETDPENSGDDGQTDPETDPDTGNGDGSETPTGEEDEEPTGDDTDDTGSESGDETGDTVSDEPTVPDEPDEPDPNTDNGGNDAQ